MSSQTAVKKIDLFVGTNVLLFLGLCVFRYYARFVEYRGAEHIEEFFVYAGAILAAIFVLWRVFRRYSFDTTILVLMQIGILMHFSGAFVLTEEGRLYDAHLAGIRYDKYVHFVNAFAGALLVSHLFRFQGIPLTRINQVLLLFVVLGLGGLVEIVEYIVVLTVPQNGVGGYDNNMQDLIANFFGCVAFLLLLLARGKRPS